MLLKRILTAAVLLPLALGLLYLGGPYQIALALVFYVLINYEFISFSTSYNSSRQLQTILSLSMLPTGFLWNSWPGFCAGLFFATILIFIFEIISEENYQKNIPALSLCISYTGIIGSLLVISSTLFSGISLIWLLGIVVVCDTAAYTVGSICGGPKLAENISPKKTISGAVGAIIASAVAAPYLGMYLGLEGPVSLFVFYGIFASVLAIFGDLFESALKRLFDTKDSGNILPGHGGVLDRIDGFLFAIIVLFFAPFA